MDKRIRDFIIEQKVLTIATSVNNQPYCASCFYAFDAENVMLIFSSEDTTKHIADACKNNMISGTINKENKTVAKIQGIQFQGEFIRPEKDQSIKFYEIYYKKYPFARAKPAPIWAIHLDWIKMTDNTLGFGSKLIWEK